MTMFLAAGAIPFKPTQIMWMCGGILLAMLAAPGLVDFGFKAVISTQFADIFSNNSLKNGLLPLLLQDEPHAWLLANPGAEVAIDVAAATLTLPDGRCIDFPLDGFSQQCLLKGIDQLGFLQGKESDIDSFEQERPWKP